MIGNFYFCSVLSFIQIKHVNGSTTVSKLKVGVIIHNYLRMLKFIILIGIFKLSYKLKKRCENYWRVGISEVAKNEH